HRALLSFPTRRSSDLELALAGTANSVDESGAASANALFGAPAGAVAGAANGKLAEFEIDFGGAQQAIKLDKDFSSVGSSKENSRSEEHTSELQSRENL